MADSITLSGAPTKRFFVSMLPRDIELDDAILDLVDNSVDGAMRQQRNNLDAEKPFANYRCDLTIGEDKFRLDDNCGGIPDAYLEAAFRLGRPLIDLDGDLPTIGMYGIGMKRAIFKMARDATVVSRSKDRAVKVRYDPDWLDPESDDWELSIDEIKDDGSVGVCIQIEDLRDDISTRFHRERFIEALAEKLGQHFAYIMGKGFEISINGDLVKPETVQVIFDDQIEPYDFVSEYGGLEIKVTIGFYRNLTRQAELEEATDPDQVDPRRRSVDEAGITVICNDRVVLISDKTSITGWGLSNIPRYHPQFRSISGLIVFYSDDAKLLPISTTKRDLDTDTDVYNHARNAAMEGISLFVGFTNRWKGAEVETDTFLTKARRVEARKISLALERGTTVRGSDGATKKYVPRNLPVPEKGTRRRRVAFSRDVEEITIMGEMLLGNPKANPSDVGVAAWEDVLDRSDKQ